MENSKIKDATGANGSTEEDRWDKTNCATSVLYIYIYIYMVDVKRPGEAVRDQNPNKFPSTPSQ